MSFRYAYRFEIALVPIFRDEKILLMCKYLQKRRGLCFLSPNTCPFDNYALLPCLDG